MTAQSAQCDFRETSKQSSKHSIQRHDYLGTAGQRYPQKCKTLLHYKDTYNKISLCESGDCLFLSGFFHFQNILEISVMMILK